MIYAGILRFNERDDITSKLSLILQHYTKTPPTLTQKGPLTLCYGKLPGTTDKDEIWENASSLLIGRAFHKETQRSLSSKDFERFSGPDKDKAFATLWGKYVFLSTDPKTNSFDVVIDPTGQLPFFYYALPNGDVLFSSDIEIIFKVLNQKPEYNWTYLCSYFVYGNSSAIQTPFQGIFELPPACSLHATKTDKTAKPFWNPLRAYESPKTNKDDAVDILQATLKPWIEPYETICVSLSGGLDSSALVYCLKDLIRDDQKLIALNYFHSQVKSSNELVHARKVCEENGIELIEADAVNCLPFDPSSQKGSLLFNKPYPGLISGKWVENTLSYLSPYKSCTFISGHGSDHIFMRPPSKKSVSDYIIEKGWRGAQQCFDDMTTFYRDTFLSILKENLKGLGSYYLGWRLGKRHSKNTQDDRPPWVKKEIEAQTSLNFVHPIYGALPKRVLPGKYTQIDAFYEGLASIHVEHDPLMPTWYPYLYEPVVDFSLSFPTYELFKEGYDRYPLRKAVSDRYNTQTVWRRDKSQTTGIFQLGVKKNLDSILTLCTEGQFVKNGFVDKEKMEETIKLISNGDTNYMWPFTHLVSTELFLQQWQDKFK